MRLFDYIYDENIDFLYEAYEKVLDSNFIIEDVCESFDSFSKYMLKGVVKDISRSIDANDFALNYFRKNIDELDPADVIKYYYVHLSNLSTYHELETIPFSYLEDVPDIRGNNLYLDDGIKKKLVIKYNENFDSYNEEIE